MMTGAINETRPGEAELLVFHEIARALTSPLDLESILTRMLRQIESFFRPETWALMLCDERKQDLFCAISGGRFASTFSELRVASGQGMAGWATKRGEALDYLRHFQAGPAPTGPQSYIDFEVRSVLCIPLRSRLQNLGVIQLFNLPQEMLSDDALSCRAL